MSAYEDKRLASRFAAVAPEPLPGDWDDVLEKAGAGRTSRRWRERSLEGRRRRIVVLAAAALVAVVGTASTFSTVRDFVLDRGFIGVPPEGATPSIPESGELVVRWEGFSATLPPPVGGPIARTWVYADGRIIWDRRSHGHPAQIPEGANKVNSGYLEQRLTPEGLELVRSAVAGLFDRSRLLLETIPADHDPWRDGLDSRLALFVPNDHEWGFVAVPDGDRLVRLRWQSAKRPDSDLEGSIATPEQLSALRRVDVLLTDPASVLPPSAWAERKVRAYVPSYYALCTDILPPKDSSDLLSLLPARAADLLRDKSGTRLGGGVATYCFKLRTDEAREVAGALSGLEPERAWRCCGVAYRVAEPVNRSDPTIIWFEPYFPHGRFTFSGPFG